MPSLPQVLRSLGNAGAVANVQTTLQEREREAWLVAGLVARLALHEAPTAADPTAAELATRVA